MKLETSHKVANYALWAVTVGLSLTDLALTRIGLNSGLKEANPLMAASPETVKFLTLGFGTLLYTIVNEKSTPAMRKMLTFAAIAAIGFNSFLVIHNALAIQTH